MSLTEKFQSSPCTTPPSDAVAADAPLSGRQSLPLREIAAPLRTRHRPGKKLHTLIFHPERCSGCGLCRSVCGGREINLAMPDAARIQIIGNPARGGSFAIFCQHCLNPRCMAACPQGAVFRDKAGIVRINKTLCVNCGLCREVCAEAAPLRDPGGDVRKCDLCDGNPRCVAACPQHALEYSGGKKARWISWLRWPIQALSFLFLVVVLVGSVCSLSIAAIDILCPTGVLQNIVSSRTLLLTTFSAALALLLLALAGGRLFCGWICPFGFVLDLADTILSMKKPVPADAPASLTARIGKMLPPSVRQFAFFANRNNKYGVLAGAAAASAMTGNQAFCTVCPIGIVCRSYGLQDTLGGAELSMIPLIAAMDVGAKRSWCRYFCPVGALFALVARFAPVSIEIGAARCKKFSCKRCAEVCPMDIISDVSLQAGEKPVISRAECILCLRCVDICPHKAAKLRFGWPRKTSDAAIPVQTGAVDATTASAGGRL